MAPLDPTFDSLSRAMALDSFDGRAAQRIVEPTDRGDRPPGSTADDVRPAYALLYVFVRDGALQFPLTERHAHLREHRGQISLPGGRPDPGESPAQTAWREAQEEVGLDVADSVDLGWLAPVYIAVTHTRLHVLVAAGPDPGPLVAAPDEVASIDFGTVPDLLDPARVVTRMLTIRERAVPIRHFQLGGYEVWGATAMALSELRARLLAVIT